MPHIHKKIDFVVTAFIVYKNKVLFVHHKILKEWLPIGGHIELDENPEQALYREIQEESGLRKNNLQVISDKPKFYGKRFKFLYSPFFLDIHKFSGQHKHINLIYFIKSNTDKIIKNKKEHNEIRWFSKKDINTRSYSVLPQIKFLAKKAFLQIS